MISTLMKQVMNAFKLTQADMAEVMEVKLQRIRDLSSGRAKKLTREESQILVDKLEIRAEWLITGEGPMLQDDESQDEFAGRQRAIGQAQAMIDALPISDEAKARSKLLISGDPIADAKTIADALAGDMIYKSAPSTVLTAREAALIDNYRAASDAGKKALETTGVAVAQPKLDDEGKAA